MLIGCSSRPILREKVGARNCLARWVESTHACRQSGIRRSASSGFQARNLSDLRSGKGGVIDSRQGSGLHAGFRAEAHMMNNGGGLTRPKSRGSRESDPSGGVSETGGGADDYI